MHVAPCSKACIGILDYMFGIRSVSATPDFFFLLPHILILMNKEEDKEEKNAPKNRYKFIKLLVVII